MLFRPIFKENSDYIIYSAKQYVSAINTIAEKLLKSVLLALPITKSFLAVLLDMSFASSQTMNVKQLVLTYQPYPASWKLYPPMTFCNFDFADIQYELLSPLLLNGMFSQVQ